MDFDFLCVLFLYVLLLANLCKWVCTIQHKGLRRTLQISIYLNSLLFMVIFLGFYEIGGVRIGLDDIIKGVYSGDSIGIVTDYVVTAFEMFFWFYDIPLVLFLIIRYFYLRNNRLAKVP